MGTDHTANISSERMKLTIQLTLLYATTVGAFQSSAVLQVSRPSASSHVASNRRCASPAISMQSSENTPSLFGSRRGLVLGAATGIFAGVSSAQAADSYAKRLGIELPPDPIAELQYGLLTKQDAFLTERAEAKAAVDAAAKAKEDIRGAKQSKLRRLRELKKFQDRAQKDAVNEGKGKKAGSY